MAEIDGAMLVGKSFDCVLGGFVPRLTFETGDTLRVQAVIGGEEIDQRVPLELVPVGGDMYIVSWAEENGNFIVQLQDHRNMVVHNHARLADGQVLRAQGTLRSAS